MKNFNNILIISLVLVVFYGCSTVPTTYIGVIVDSYGSDANLTKKTYMLMPEDTNINPDDLEFSEYAEKISTMLLAAGYNRTYNYNDANLLIIVRYGISDPQTYKQSVPVIGLVPTGEKTTTGTIRGRGNNATYTEKTTEEKSFGVTGYRNVTATVFTRHLALFCYDLDYSKINKTEKIIWKSFAVSTGSKNDLRAIFPYLTRALEQYIGKNTGQKIEKSFKYIDKNNE